MKARSQSSSIPTKHFRQRRTQKNAAQWTKSAVVGAGCCYLYAYAKPAWSKAMAWSRRQEEFAKRASFSLVAYLSYKDKVSPNARFAKFLQVIEREAHDERNFVRKAVNWALRNI